MTIFNLAIFVSVSGVLFVKFAIFADVVYLGTHLFDHRAENFLDFYEFPSNLRVRSMGYMMEKFVLFIWIRGITKYLFEGPPVLSVLQDRFVACFS